MCVCVCVCVCACVSGCKLVVTVYVMGCWRNTHSAESIYPHRYSRSRDMTQFWIFINNFLEPVFGNKGTHSCRSSFMNIFQPVSSWMAIIFQRETDPDICMLQRQMVARCEQTHKCSS